MTHLNSSVESKNIKPSQDAPDFAALDAIFNVLRSWWLVAILVALGGLAGLGATRLLPVKYEGGFDILTGVDQVNTGALTQYSQDVMMDAVGDILFAPSTLQQVASAARAKGIQIDANELGNSASRQRQVSTWQIRIQRSSQAEVNTLADLWAGIGAADLKAAYAHAQNADGLKRFLSSLESCLTRAVTNDPAAALCAPGDLAGLQNEMKKTGTALSNELAAAQGLSSGVLVNTMEKGLLPARATHNQRGQFVLMGGLIGLILGMWAAQAGVGTALARRVRRG